MKSIERVRDMSCQKKIVTIFFSEFLKGSFMSDKADPGWEWEFFWRTWKIAHFRAKVNPRGLTRNVIIFLGCVWWWGMFTFHIYNRNIIKSSSQLVMLQFIWKSSQLWWAARWWIDKVRGERSKTSTEASVRQSEWVTKAELNEMIAHLFLYESRTHIFLHIFSDRIKLV